MAACDVEALPPDCFLSEDGADPGTSPFVALLGSVCRLCPPWEELEAEEPPPRGSAAVHEAQGDASAGAWRSTSRPCREDDGTLADLALGIIMRARQSFCTIGVLAAYLVTTQYSGSTRPFDIAGSMLEMARAAPSFSVLDNKGFDLRPFPFWSQRRSLAEQFGFHSRFASAHLFGCTDGPGSSEAEALRGRFELRAGHDKPEVHCAARQSNFQLVVRCRDRRRYASALLAESGGGRGAWSSSRTEAARLGISRLSGLDAAAADNGAAATSPLSAIRCPDDAARAAFAAGRAVGKEASAHRKYLLRSSGPEQSGLGCDDPAAEWRADLAPYHKCILVVIFERLRLPPGAKVLDWGTVSGVGMLASEPAVTRAWGSLPRTLMPPGTAGWASDEQERGARLTRRPRAADEDEKSKNKHCARTRSGLRAREAGTKDGALSTPDTKGCGHKLTWASQFYGVEGLGLDFVGDSIAWAREHSVGHYCEVDGRFLDWLPDDAFDAVISYAALMHLEAQDQCDVVVDLVGKVAVGGRLWFGWNEPGIHQNETELKALLENETRVATHEEWRECFERAAHRHPRWISGEINVAWETIEERFLFPDDLNAIAVYLYYPPAYSLFVTRVPQGQAHHYAT
eukprot:TRINITY_DN9686_c0_g1_i1.p1 TRINITY_DN9686_c0_g1~~TRINITY_DN9686_c0_g1_i1.p1  ORF type:complete len:641 (+),score=121.00 TRINITY_DN9686_c0_g1_i1:41-1924(+)